MKTFKLILNSCVIILFLFVLMGTIFFSCTKTKKQDKIVIQTDTIFVIDTICPTPIKTEINDSLMFIYIKKRNERIINKIKNDKGIIFNSDEINKFKNY